MIEPAWAALIASALLLLGDQCNRRWFGWLPDDPPRPGRKQHARPVPLAGVLVVPATAPFLWWERAHWPGAAFAALAIVLSAFVGFVDDRGKEHGRDLDWRWKALGLGLAAAAAATSSGSPLDAPGPWLAGVALTFVLVNAFNFLDNTDGVSASLAAVALLAGAHGAPWPAACGFAALAFVPWNWPRPRLFLGDGGAYALGTMAAVWVLARLRHDPRALWLVAVPLVDFVQVVIARLWLGHPPWVGDRRHLTHIVQNLGLPRVLVAPLFAAVAFGLCWLAR